MAAQRKILEAAGTQLAFVHLGSEERAAPLFQRYGLADVPRISDPAGTLYRALELRRGGLIRLFGGQTWWRGLQAIGAGHRGGRMSGDVLRLPGVFLLYQGRVLKSYRHQFIADRPDYAAFLRDQAICSPPTPPS